MLFLYWAIAIIAAAFLWWLIKKIGIVGWILTVLHRNRFWHPPVDPYLKDEYDMYD